MTSTKRKQWEERVARWQESGLTAKQFAAEAGVNHRTLAYWKYRLRKEGTGQGASPAVASSGGFVEVPQAEVVVVERKRTRADAVPCRAGRAARASEPLELRLPSGLRVVVPTGFEAATLQRLLAMLEVR
jgi:hypothetical protein